MIRSSTIRSLLAGMMLVLFAFSITPKRWLHNIVARHKDGRPGSLLSYSDKFQYNKATFNCQCDNLVAESPFTQFDAVIDLFVPFVYQVYQDQPHYAFLSSGNFCFRLRGPPGMIPVQSGMA